MYEVSRVANGYMVRPAYNESRCGFLTTDSEIFVFNKFADLSEFLSDKLKPEGDE